jgi:hypothetical protein
MEASNKTSLLDIRRPDVSYERRDLSHRAVFGTLLVLFCAGILIHLVVWSVFRYLGGSQFVPHQTTNPIMTSNEELKEVGGDPALSFPAPHLQPNPVADLNKFRVREEQELNTYGWIDPQAGKIHIPIERAIDVMASSWPQQQEAASDEGRVTPEGHEEPPETIGAKSGGGR